MNICTLYLSAPEGKLRMAQLLIEYSVKLNACDIKQQNALETLLLQIASRQIIAESRKEKDLVNLLVGSGAKVQFRYEEKE